MQRRTLVAVCWIQVVIAAGYVGFDWKGVAISTLIGISTLSLDTNTGKILYGLFRQAFITLSHLMK